MSDTNNTLYILCYLIVDVSSKGMISVPLGEYFTIEEAEAAKIVIEKEDYICDIIVIFDSKGKLHNVYHL